LFDKSSIYLGSASAGVIETFPEIAATVILRTDFEVRGVGACSLAM